MPSLHQKKDLKFTETNYFPEIALGEETSNKTELYSIIEKQNSFITNSNKQISELKLYLTNFIFKVFDLNIIYRKNLGLLR